MPVPHDMCQKIRPGSLIVITNTALKQCLPNPKVSYHQMISKTDEKLEKFFGICKKSVSKFLLPLIATVLLNACATKQRLGFEELSRFKIDCDKRHEQYEFLESQKYSSDERIVLYFQTLFPPTLFTMLRDGTLKDNHDGMDGKHEAMIRMAQRQIRQHCASVDYHNRSMQEQKERLAQREKELWGK